MEGKRVYVQYTERREEESDEMEKLKQMDEAFKGAHDFSGGEEWVPLGDIELLPEEEPERRRENGKRHERDR